MTAIMPTIRKMTNEEADQRGLYIKELVLDYVGRRENLYGGTTTYFSSRDLHMFLLSLNPAWGLF